MAGDLYTTHLKAMLKRLLKLLIKRGANINAQDINGFTPLHIASSSKCKRCC